MSAEDHVVQPEGLHQRARGLVLRFVAGADPVTVRPQILVQVPAVQVHDDVRGFDDLVGHEGEGALGLRP